MSIPDAPWFTGSDPCWLASPAAAGVLRRAIRVPQGLAVALGPEVELGRQFAGVQPDPSAGRCDFVIDQARDDLGAEGFEITRTGDDLTVTGTTGRALLYGFLRLLTVGDGLAGRHVPAYGVRMLDHWDNMVPNGPMGQVERGYAGGSIFFEHGKVREDLSRVVDYARLVASIGINAVCINNVNVHETETRLLTDHLDGVARIAQILRRYGISTYLAVNFASPVTLGDLDTADPLDERVRAWWRDTALRVQRAVPWFGGFVVKADSEGRPGPFTYGRTHADGANMLAEALAAGPYGGTVFWRCFVYNHTQDWRDRTTDRARAAYDHFLPHDGTFADNVVLQVKNGPMDFQVREPVSPLFFGLRDTAMVCELQITQEYTGQQQHAVYLGPWWSEVLAFPSALTGDEPPLRDLPRLLGLTAVANIGTDRTWTGHPFAQANLYAYGRLAWDPTGDPEAILREWATATYAPEVVDGVVDILRGSWLTYERYTSPLGVGWMVYPHHHYGPSVDGYEYTPWGTYHFADRDGIGVDRTPASGSGFAGQYPEPVARLYGSLETCPDELLLFFHHVPYTHVLHSQQSVIQHIYDTHADGVDEVEAMVARWNEIAPAVPEPNRTEITTRFAEHLRSAKEWRDQVRTYFFRKSGIPDATGRRIY